MEILFTILVSILGLIAAGFGFLIMKKFYNKM